MFTFFFSFSLVYTHVFISIVIINIFALERNFSIDYTGDDVRPVGVFIDRRRGLPRGELCNIRRRILAISTRSRARADTCSMWLFSFTFFFFFFAIIFVRLDPGAASSSLHTYAVSLKERKKRLRVGAWSVVVFLLLFPSSTRSYTCLRRLRRRGLRVAWFGKR